MLDANRRKTRRRGGGIRSEAFGFSPRGDLKVVEGRGSRILSSYHRSTSTDMAPRIRSTRQRKNKLEALLQDFDSKVKTMVERLEEKRNNLLNSAANTYDCDLIKLPNAISQRNWLEYCRSGKPISPEVDPTKRDEEAAKVESVLAVPLPKSAKKLSKKPTGANSSSEDENTPNQSTVKKAKTKRKPPTTSKRAQALTVTKQNISRTSKRLLVTPARSMMDSSLLMGPTPLVTPRFDPSLREIGTTERARGREGEGKQKGKGPFFLIKLWVNSSEKVELWKRRPPVDPQARTPQARTSRMCVQVMR